MGDSPTVTDGRAALVGQTRDSLAAAITAAGFPEFRARQVHEWIYRKGVAEPADMRNIGRELQEWLGSHYQAGMPEVAEERVSADGSRKLILRLGDGRIVESVLIREREWWTLCISSQVGCAVGCTFCLTGFGGFKRQMTAGEIVGQVLVARRIVEGDGPRNIVFMGMGEPLLNMDELVPALDLLTEPEGIGISPRRITVSTSGILPGIERLGNADRGVHIAISLNASTDEFRSEIMPINRTYPIADLLEACRRFPLKRRRRITFEYVLLGGQNDSVADARRLAKLLHGLACKVNLIPWNPDPRLTFKRPSDSQVLDFQKALLERGVSTSVRFSKGLDVGGACGQLAGHMEAAAR